MPQHIADILTSSAARDFVGREAELARICALLAPEGPRVIHVSGIAGIGKSSLLEVFAERARRSGATVLRLDCRAIEPTGQAFLQALCQVAGIPEGRLEEVVRQLGAEGRTVVLVLDTYEVFRLLDAWLRQSFVPALPDNLRVLLSGRERPQSAWYVGPGWRGLFLALTVDSLASEEGVALLCQSGVAPDTAVRMARSLHGHPLALQLAASVYSERPAMALAEAPLQQALTELTRMFLGSVGDDRTRQLLEGVAVVRRVTVTLLSALFAQRSADEAYECLRGLPFVEGGSDGLMLHDVVREAIAASLRARDPTAYTAYRRAAWHQLCAETALASRTELWRYTADMLYLIENPVVREAFFPAGTQQLAVEPAGANDHAVIAAIVARHDGPQAAAGLLRWWPTHPHAFSVVRDRDGRATGLCCRLEPARVGTDELFADPVTAAWHRHLQADPLPVGQTALFCRRWLGAEQGESPGEVQAAVWLDLKRTYMEMRPALRRVYLTLRDLAPYGAAAERLGFRILPGLEVELDGMAYHTAMLDFGPGSVDGWLAGLAGAELGIRSEAAWLDVDARELVLGARRVGLTPLEFGVMARLSRYEGKAVSRTELLNEVWNTRYEGGSNVVDAVIRTLRHKLGEHAGRVETVTGVGYRLRAGR